MSDRTFARKKATASDFSQPSLISPTTPTLANPTRGFGLPANNELSTQQQEVQSADERSLEQQLIQEKPLGHDISRISFRRPQAKLTVGEPGDKYEQEADMMAHRVMSMPAPTVQQHKSLEKVQTQPLAIPQKTILEKEQEIFTPSLSTAIQRDILQEEEKLQTKPALQKASNGSLQAGDSIESQLNSSKGGGSPLADAMRSFMEPRFGADFSQVRVHTDSNAVQMNRDLGAQAFTHGSDVYYGEGKAPGNNELTAHELTHVVQQIGGVHQKQNAGQQISHTITPKVQRFEAQHHEHLERAALTAPGADDGQGFSDAEASATYFGNWSRDFSQAFSNNPIRHLFGNDMLFELLNVLAMHKFGRQLNPQDFGVYSPREHIDNPAGQINADLLSESRGERHFSQFGSDQQPNSPEEDISSPEAVAQLFIVNEAGLPAYIGRSIQYVEEEFSTAADLGRNADGLMHFGNGLHTVEDLFAHSNYIEIAISKLIQEQAINLDPDLSEEMQKREQEGLDPIENFAGMTTGGRPILMTGSFVTADTLISISEAITAFLNSFDPFGVSNAQRNQQTMEMILERYEKLSQNGQAGQIIQPFLQNLSGLLTAELAQNAQQAIAGEQPREDASLFDRVVAEVRSIAGSVVSAGINLSRQLLENGSVRQFIGNAINQFGNLPLLTVYKFIIKQKNSITDFFDRLDKWLQPLPFYEQLKGLLHAPMDQLREMLKPPIQSAVRFMGELIQTAFAEAEVAGTNIENQIQQQIEANIHNPEAINQLQQASPEEQISMLMNPDWCREANISPTDAERLRQMLQSPDYVRAGPSHSQIAKDHADSPFFGAAAALAGHVDTQMRDRMIAVWAAEGRGADSDLQNNYGDEIPPDIADRRAPPGTPESQMTDDQRRAEREAAEVSPHYRELIRREEGERLLREGALPEGEEAHGAEEAYEGMIRLLRKLSLQAQQLPDRLRSLSVRLQTVAPNLAGEISSLAEALPANLDQLADQIQQTTDLAAMQQIATRLHALAQEINGWVGRVQRVLRQVADRIKRLDGTFDEIADELADLASLLDQVMPRFGTILSQVADRLQERGDRRLRTQTQIDRVHHLPPVQTQAWSQEFSNSHARSAPGQEMSPQRQELFNYVRQIINHPYESDWWRQPLLKWCATNHERLEAYIRARNSDEMHHHH